MTIVRPITDDGLVGYDQFNQLTLCAYRDADSMVFKFIHDVRREKCIICDRGWEATGPSMGDQLYWDLTKSHVHRSCSIRHEGLCERQQIWSAIVGAKIRFGGLLPISNGYWPHSDPWSAKPWYEAELLDFPVRFVVGARKRVLNIEVHAQGGTKLDWWERAEEMFKDEDVTKEFSSRMVLIHAWGTEKMRQYVKQIADLAGYANR
jgi:hypothetical protein